MSSQITKITSGDLRNGLFKGLKSSTTTIINSYSNKQQKVQFTTSSNNNNNNNNNEPITKKARSQVIREKKQTEKEEEIQSKMMMESLDKEYDGKSYSSHYRDDPDRLKYKSPYSGRELPYIPSTLDLLTNGYAITEEFDGDEIEEFEGNNIDNSDQLYQNAKLMNRDYDNEYDEDEDREIASPDEEDEEDDLYSDGGGFRYAQVNLDNVGFEFVPENKIVLNPEIAKLSKPNQEQFIKMVSTISQVFTNLDDYLREYADQFTNYELSYFDTAMKVLREEYILNPEFRKSFNEESSSSSSSQPSMDLTQKESIQANKDVEILLANLLKELNIKKLKESVEPEKVETLAKSIKAFSENERDLIKDKYCEENGVELDEDLNRELDEEIDEMENEEFEDDQILEKSRFLDFDLEAFKNEKLIKESTLFDHLKTIESKDQRKSLVNEFMRFKANRDQLRSQSIIRGLSGAQSLNDLVEDHYEFMDTEKAIYQKLEEIKQILFSSGVAATKLHVVKDTQLNTIRDDQGYIDNEKYIQQELLELGKETDAAKNTELVIEEPSGQEGDVEIPASEDEFPLYDKFADLYENEQGLVSLIDELKSNFSNKQYPEYQLKSKILLQVLDQINQDNQSKLDDLEFGKLSNELQSLFNASNNITTSADATATANTTTDADLIAEDLEVKQQQLNDLKSLLELRIKQNYKDLDKEDSKLLLSNDLFRLEEGIEMFKELGLSVDPEIVEKVIFDTKPATATTTTTTTTTTAPVKKSTNVTDEELFEPVQLIKALYKLGPNKFQDVVDGLKRLPNMVYYCKYINNRYLDPKASYIAPLSMLEVRDQRNPIGPRLDFDDEEVEEDNIIYMTEEQDEESPKVPKDAENSEEDEILEIVTQENPDAVQAAEEYASRTITEDNEDGDYDNDNSLTFDESLIDVRDAFKTTEFGKDSEQDNIEVIADLLIGEEEELSEDYTESEDISLSEEEVKQDIKERQINQIDYIDEAEIDDLHDDGLTEVNDVQQFKESFIDNYNNKEVGDSNSGFDKELNEMILNDRYQDGTNIATAKEIDENTESSECLTEDITDELTDGITDDLTEEFNISKDQLLEIKKEAGIKSEEDDGSTSEDYTHNEMVGEQENAKGLSEEEYTEEEYTEEDQSEDVEETEDVGEDESEDSEDSENDDQALESDDDPFTNDVRIVSKSDFKRIQLAQQVDEIKDSFPFFGIDDDLDVQDIILEGDADADLADNIFLLEASTLLAKGNIMDNPSKNTRVYLDPLEEENEEEDDSILEKFGYNEDDLMEEEDLEEFEENNEMGEEDAEEEEGDDNADKDNIKAVNDDNEMQYQFKDENDWRDVPSLHISNLVDVSRHVKVTKAGRVSSYSCTVFKGDGNGSASLGYGKGDSASTALKRASRDAERNAFTLDRYNDLTLPSGLDLKHRSTKIRFFKSRSIDQMDYRGMKQNIILPTIGLHGVTFRTYGRRGWDNVLLTLQKCLPGYINPEEAARIMGKRFVTSNNEKEKKKTLSELLQSKLEKRNNDPYNLGMVSKFLYDVEEKPNMDKIKERRARQELLDLFDRYPTSPSDDHHFTTNNSFTDNKYNNNSSSKRIDKMNEKGRKHERNIRNNSI